MKLRIYEKTLLCEKDHKKLQAVDRAVFQSNTTSAPKLVFQQIEE